MMFYDYLMIVSVILIGLAAYWIVYNPEHNTPPGQRTGKANRRGLVALTSGFILFWLMLGIRMIHQKRENVPVPAGCHQECQVVCPVK